MQTDKKMKKRSIPQLVKILLQMHGKQKEVMSQAQGYKRNISHEHGKETHPNRNKSTDLPPITRHTCSLVTSFMASTQVPNMLWDAGPAYYTLLPLPEAGFQAKIRSSSEQPDDPSRQFKRSGEDKDPKHVTTCLSGPKGEREKRERKRACTQPPSHRQPTFKSQQPETFGQKMLIEAEGQKQKFHWSSSSDKRVSHWKKQ